MRRPLHVLVTLALSATVTTLAVPAALAAPAADPAPSADAPAAVPDELLVGYAPGSSDDVRSRARGRVQARLAETVVRAAADRGEVERVVLPRGRDRGQAIAALQSDPAVRYAEPNWVVQALGKPTPAPAPTFTAAPVLGTTADPFYVDRSTWGLRGGFGSGADAAWPTATSTATTYVGVIDEGIQVTHPDLAGMVGNPGEIAGNDVDDDGNGKVDDVYGYDFAGTVDNNSVYDGGPTGTADNHGTHVSGTIAARHDATGVPGVTDSGTRLISGKFLGTNGGDIADAVQAVEYFTDLKVNHKVNIVATSNSWGGGGFSQALLDAITGGARAGITFVAAAGNSGTNNDRRPSYPSGYSTLSSTTPEAVVAVAAIDERGALASFSQYGATTVDLGAPGVAIRSTTADNGGYSTYNGTSMATPHVTGAIALYASAHPGATVATIRQALLASARETPTASLSGKTVTGGRLDIPLMLTK